MERIKAVREALGITQTQFANALGIGRSAISLLESGKNEPAERTIRALCTVYHVNREWLESGNGEMFTTATDYETETILAALEGQSLVKRELMLMIAELPDETLDQLADRLIAVRRK